MPASTNTTTVVAVGGKGRSVRTVIPLWVVQQIGIEAGDKISWNLKVEEGELRVVIKKEEK